MIDEIKQRLVGLCPTDQNGRSALNFPIDSALEQIKEELIDLFSPEDADQLVSRFGKTHLFDLLLRLKICREKYFDILSRLEEGKESLRVYEQKLQQNSLQANDYVLHEVNVDLVNIIKSVEQAVNVLISTYSVDSISSYQEKKSTLNNIDEMYRYFLQRISLIMTGLDWQSISIQPGLHSRVFSELDFEQPGLVGYKRFNYPALESYERWFLTNQVECNNPNDLTAILTSSGMGALSVVLQFLKNKLRSDDAILFSESMYCECSQLMEMFFGDSPNIAKFSQEEPRKIVDIVKEKNIRAILLEPIANTETMQVVDMPGFIKILQSETWQDDIFVIADTSVTAGGEKLFETYNSQQNPHVHLIGVESLIKYRQLGNDRVNAGVIIAEHGFRQKLQYIRQATGTFLSDQSLHQLPRLPKESFLQYLRIIQRNSLFLTDKINETLAGIDSPFEKAIHPTKVAPEVCQKMQFSTGLIALQWKEGAQGNCFEILEKMVSQIITQAKVLKLDIDSGTSFGFSSTRFYIAPTNHRGHGNFLRISVGVEPILDILKIAEIICNTIKEAPSFIG
ncbi:MAG: PLP-dependent transferase [Candidatus Peribacteraceae bacterium]|nr:PLP-dependent transferase [Candidatus Peribacteraceae bacterium]